MDVVDYTSITELPGSALTAEQWARIHHRYTLAQRLAHGRAVLEVACGAGVALPVLASTARTVVGGDYTGYALAAARQQSHTAQPSISLVQYDAQRLPFADDSFDLVFSFEAIYYLESPHAFLAEARRVLTPGGCLLIGTENPAWPHFMPGNLSTRYWNAAELSAMMAAQGFDAIQCFGAFPVTAFGVRQRQMARLRGYLLRHGLLPRGPALRRLLQRIGYGQMHVLPPSLCAENLTHAPIASIAPALPNPEYKVIYVQGVARDNKP
jgi:SAM-dependent methyltransferase